MFRTTLKFLLCLTVTSGVAVVASVPMSLTEKHQLFKRSAIEDIKPGHEYVYHYKTQLLMQDINRHNPPTGFGFEATIKFANVYNQFFKLSLEQPTYNNPTAPSAAAAATTTTATIPNSPLSSVAYTNHPIYAHVDITDNGTAIINSVYVHKRDTTTYVNLKKTILLNLLPTTLHYRATANQRINNVDNQRHRNTNEIDSSNYSDQTGTCSVSDDNSLSQPELFSPDAYSQVVLDVTPSLQYPGLYEQINGYQNVTFKSRIYEQAQSQLTTTLSLKLTGQQTTDDYKYFEHSKSITDAIESLDAGAYSLDKIDMKRERKRCVSHHCDKSLYELFNTYRDVLTDDSLASVEQSIAYLQLLERLRQANGATLEHIGDVLKKLKNNQNGLLSSFLDILAAARTKESILASLKHLKLAKSKDLDTTERFLSVLSVSAKIASKMRPHHRRPLSAHYVTPMSGLKSSPEREADRSTMASIQFIAQELFYVLKGTPAKQWKSNKLRWSTLLTLSSLVNAHNIEHDYANMDDELNQQVSKLLITELAACPKHEADCRVVAIQGIGNIGNLNLVNFQALKEQILDSGRREAIASMKALRDCLRNCAPDQRHRTFSFYGDLRDLLIRVVYDQHQETTARILAAELIIKFIPDSFASDQLIAHLPSFGNPELATMIWSRIVSLRPEAVARHHHDNWYWKSCIINGTSASFIKNMASTQSLNASYSVNIEVNKKKILKESSFDVMLDTNQRTQDLLSLSLFARGLGSLPGVGDSDDADSNDDESAMAGMNLRVLGNYLRPYVFFNGQGELLSHIWSGTASDPTTAFAGDLLLIDHEEAYPLISGFLVEQQMRGVLSIDVTGMVKVSLWNRNSNSVVRTKAAVSVQSSQSVFTSHDQLWSSHMFSFGGQALIDFIADIDFYSQPVKICIQVMQPEFKFRLHTRKYEQLLAKSVQRRFWKRSYTIGAKSYSLNRVNNEMCSIMNEDH